MVRTKMCGLFREEDIKYANEIKPEYIGFVFYKKSHRYVDFETAKKLRSMLNKDITAVGVFVDEDISFIKELVDEKIIDMVQLHGSEDSDYISKLRESIDNPDLKIIKAIVIKNGSSLFESPNNFPDSGDFYLLDSGMGGGSSFNWNLVKELDKPVFLAGGLNPENVTEAINIVKPFAVDVSSGIESNKVKDIVKMRLFISNVRKEND